LLNRRFWIWNKWRARDVDQIAEITAAVGDALLASRQSGKRIPRRNREKGRAVQLQRMGAASGVLYDRVSEPLVLP